MKCIIFSELALENLYNTIVNMFNYYNKLPNNKGKIKWFLGGSYRFGYHNEDSDLDFFVLLQNDFNIRFPYFLIMNDFDRINPKDMVDYPDGTIGYKHNKYDIHIILFQPEEKNRWEALAKKHDDIYNLLEKYPVILNFIKVMKSSFVENEFSFKGKWFYRTMEKLVNEYNK